MKKIKAKLLKVVALARGFFPKKLPAGRKEFEAFITSICETYDFPDLPSYRQAVATIIMHFGPQTDHVAPRHFAKSIRKSQANQVAYEMIQELKEKAKSDAEKIVEIKPGSTGPSVA